MNENKAGGLRLVGKADLILILAIVFACALFLLPRFWNRDRLTATITCNGSVVETIDLGAVRAPYTVCPDTSPTVVILVERGAIRFESAQCPDQLCVHTGALSHAGQVAACLPARTVIAVTGEHGAADRDMPDIMTY